MDRIDSTFLSTVIKSAAFVLAMFAWVWHTGTDIPGWKFILIAAATSGTAGIVIGLSRRNHGTQNPAQVFFREFTFTFTFMSSIFVAIAASGSQNLSTGLILVGLGLAVICGIAGGWLGVILRG